MDMARGFRQAILGLALAQSALAWSTQAEYPAQRVETPPVIDGQIAQGEWNAMTHATGFLDPVTGRPAEEQTEVWFGYDGQFIYVAARMHDSKPSAIVAKQTQPGASLESDDTFTVSIDPFGRKQWDDVSSFTINARGTQHDKFAGGRSSKKEWRGEWDAIASIDAEGWSVELRIPWKILQLPPKGTRDIAINMVRHHQRLHVSSWLANMGQDYRWERAAAWQGVEVPSSSENRLRFQGYLSIGLAGKAVDPSCRARRSLQRQLPVHPSRHPQARLCER